LFGIFQKEIRKKFM